MKTTFFVLVHALFFFALRADAQMLQTFPIGGDAAGWDYLAVKPNSNLLYVSHGTRVHILDKNTGENKGLIDSVTGVHGIAFSPLSNHTFITCGKLNCVKVYEGATAQRIAEIPTGNNPDAVFYEPFSQKIIVCNGKSNSISVIDDRSNTLIKTIALGGKPETAVSNGKGKIFVNLEDKNEIVAIDARTFTLTQHWKLGDGTEPSGLVMDVKTNRLMSTCDKLLVILNATSGKIVQKIPIGEGCDGAAFDTQTRLLYTSNGEAGTLSVIHEKDANHFIKLKDIPTQQGARTIAIDPDTHRLYLPTADFDAQAKDARGRTNIKADTFRVLVVAQSPTVI